MKTKRKYFFIITSVYLQELLKNKKNIESLFNIFSINYKSFFVPIEKKKITLLKSPHVNKKSREQFERKKFKCIFIIKEKLSENFIIWLKNNSLRYVTFSFIYFDKLKKFTYI